MEVRQPIKVSVKPYNPQWISDFLAIKSELEEALAQVTYISIEHIGSTSVPGLSAKPIIDVDIVVKRANVHLAIAACEAVGYENLGQRNIPDRYSMRAYNHKPARNLYVCVEGCLSLKNHLAVRSLLRSNEDLRNEYGNLKLELAKKRWNSIDEYCEAKGPIINKILDQSELDKQDLAEIMRVNKGSDLFGWDSC